MTPRNFDHAVLPVESLEAARSRYEALGFSVAADAQHPFGTENACVFFSDGTYLEPLAVGQREDCESTALEGNVFTGSDQAYRFRVGENGFSALAFGSDDAKKDHETFKALGISAGQKLSFSREFVDGAGKKGEASFLLSFAKDDRAPDAMLFTCERANVPTVDRSPLTAHANGVTGIKEIILSEHNPSDFQYFMQPVVGNRETHSHSFGMEVMAGNVNLNALTPEGMAAQFGVRRQSLERGLRCEGIVYTVGDGGKLKAALAQAGIVARYVGRYLVVDKAAGQGAFFAFEMEA